MLTTHQPMTTVTGIVAFVAPVAVVVGAVLGAALNRTPGWLGFLKSWALYALGIVAVGVASAMLGQIMRNTLCGSVWYAECL